MRRTMLVVVLIMALAFCLYGRDNIMNEVYMTKTLRKAMPEKAPFELELKYARNGVPGTSLGPDNVPWTASVNASTGNPSDPDRDIHLVHGSDGSIWLGWAANTGDYSVAIAKSVDNGATWDERYYGSGTNTFEYAALSMNDGGYLRLWTTITTSPTYNNDILWLQSQDGFPNDIDNLEGWFWFGAGAADDYHEPEAVQALGTDYHTGLEVVVWTNGTDDPGADVDSVEIWWTDFGSDSGYSYVNLGSADGVMQLHPAAALCVPADTFRMIAFEEDSTTTGYYNVVFWRIDSVGASVWFHGWSSFHFTGTRCPSLAAEGDFAYVAYEIYDGSQYDVLYNYSSDAADTWGGTFEYIANNATDDERHPRLTSDSSRVGATYTYDDGSITNRFIYSDQSGQPGSWSAEEIITDSTTNEDGYRCVEIMWYAANNCWYAAWSDTRSGATDVYTAYRQAGTAQIQTIPATPDSFIYFNYSSKLGHLSFITKYCEKVYEPVLSVGTVERLEKAREDELIGVLITMKAQISEDYMRAMTAPLKRKEKARFVFREKRPFADETQAELLAYLREMEEEGKATRISSIFTGNRIGVRATKEVIETIARRDDVGWITPEVPVSYFGYTEGGVGEVPLDPRAIEANLIAINADDVWADGYAGQGIIAAVMDGGSNYDHDDLDDHIWTGGGLYPNGGWDYQNGDNDPYNPGNSHGTICAGIVCGDGTSGDTTGVAPECSLMILQTGTNLDMHNAVDFAIAGGRPGTGYGDPADVITSSVGFEYGQFGSDAAWENMKNEFRPDAVDLRDAGIPWTCAAGNGNSIGGGHYTVPDDIIIAANCPPPWIHPDQSPVGGTSAVIAVGATNNGRSRTTWSSYGPSDWFNGTYNDYRYTPMLGFFGLIKPDIMAPGSNLTSVHNTIDNAYDSGNSGTSFSAPHVCGAIAVMLSKDGSLTPARIDSILETTTLPVTSSDPPGKDSLNGSGFLNLEAACLGIGTAQKGILKVINDNASTANLLVTSITKTEPWIVNIEPTSFSVSAGDTQYVDVWADTLGMGLGPGTHYDTLFIESNSETKTTTIVEVRLQMGPLNISMTNLTATGYIGRIELNWRTASEYNLEAWQITRSETAEGDYTVVGAMEGHGTTGTPHDYTFVDRDVQPGQQYFYKLVSIDNMGKTTFGPVSATALVGPSVNGLKLAMNPARNARVLFNVSHASKVSLKVYDLTGRLVKTLVNGVLSPNSYTIAWDGKNDIGGVAGNGVYFIRMSSDGEESTLKLTLLK